MANPDYRAVVNRLTIIDNPSISEVWLDGVAIYSKDIYYSVPFHSRLNEEELAEFRAFIGKVNARISDTMSNERKVKGWGDQEENKPL